MQEFIRRGPLIEFVKIEDNIGRAPLRDGDYIYIPLGSTCGVGKSTDIYHEVIDIEAGKMRTRNFRPMGLE